MEHLIEAPPPVVTVAERVCMFWNMKQSRRFRLTEGRTMKAYCEAHGFSYAYAKYLVFKGNRVAKAHTAEHAFRPKVLTPSMVRQYTSNEL